jgi:hypothetical protein
VHRDDVRVVQRGEGPRLVTQPIAFTGDARPEPREELEGHFATELRVARAVDDAHPALAHLFEDSILAKLGADLHGHRRRCRLGKRFGEGRHDRRPAGGTCECPRERSRRVGAS